VAVDDDHHLLFDCQATTGIGKVGDHFGYQGSKQTGEMGATGSQQHTHQKEQEAVQKQSCTLTIEQRMVKGNGQQNTTNMSITTRDANHAPYQSKK
jgi:hypothetical protein